MNKLILSIFGLITGAAFAQTLQFSQVLLVGNTPQTVPPNKVWKIESANLTLKDGIRKDPRFRINTDTIVMGYSSYNSTIWENVNSIVVQVKNTGSSCGNVTANMRILGSGTTGAIDQIFQQAGVSINYANFTTIATFTLNSPGNNVIDKWSMWWQQSGSNISEGLEVRIIVRMNSGKEWVDVYDFSGGGSCSNYGNGGTFWNMVANSSSYSALTRVEVSRPQISTAFPIWVPQNTVVQGLDNIGSLSIIEFNIVP